MVFGEIGDHQSSGSTGADLMYICIIEYSEEDVGKNATDEGAYGYIYIESISISVYIHMYVYIYICVWLFLCVVIPIHMKPYLSRYLKVSN